MKRLFLIRHAKSSWADEDLDDFDRPLNKRGKRDALEMAKRLGRLGVLPDIIIASPARRTRKTAKFMAEETGFPVSDIIYDEGLYLGSTGYYTRVLQNQFAEADTIFLVGHNYTITELAEHLADIALVNVPTCGIVAIEYAGDKGFSGEAGGGRLLFFDFPKNPSSRE